MAADWKVRAPAVNLVSLPGFSAGKDPKGFEYSKHSVHKSQLTCSSCFCGTFLNRNAKERQRIARKFVRERGTLHRNRGRDRNNLLRIIQGVVVARLVSFQLDEFALMTQLIPCIECDSSFQRLSRGIDCFDNQVTA